MAFKMNIKISQTRDQVVWDIKYKIRQETMRYEKETF